MGSKFLKTKKRNSNVKDTLNITPDGILKIIGDSSLLKDTADGTISGAISDIYLRLGNFKFLRSENFVSAIYEYIGLPVKYLNPLINNLFDINELESTIRNSVETSFNYLNKLENSFINISKTVLDENDVYRDLNFNRCVSIDKDFIISQNRKIYKTSKFYNKYITIEDINKNRNLFIFYPIVIIDDKMITDFKIKCPIDGMTEISFGDDYDNLHFNKMQVYLIRDCMSTISSMDKITLINRNYTLPISILPKKEMNESDVFYSLIGDDKKISGLYKVKFTDSKNFIIDKNIPEISKIIDTSKKLKFTFIRINNFYNSSIGKMSKNRIGLTTKSFISVISPDNKKDYSTFDKPIPIDNIVVTRRNISSNVYNTNISIVDDVKITKHYPNIYEFEILDSYKDDENVTYDISFLYDKSSNIFKFKNKFKAIYRFLCEKYKPLNVEEITESFIYEKNSDISLLNIFMKMFNYDDYDYVYNIEDFRNSIYKEGFDYKLNKMDDFIKEDPDILRQYLISVISDFENYYLDVSSLNLSERLRLNTELEINDPVKLKTFSVDHYMFILINNDRYPANYRVFVDGISTPDAVIVNQGFSSYIYIPKEKVKDNSFIEIEKLYQYTNQNKLVFESINKFINVDFSDNPFISPTINDIFITDSNYNHLDIDDFDIYTDVNGTEIEISPKLNNLVVYEDSYNPKNDHYIKIVDKYVNAFTSQIPIKYIKIKKLKIRLTNINYVGDTLYLFINKESVVTNTKVTDNTTPKIKLNSSFLPCRNEDSYIRTFIDDRFVNIPHKIVNEANGISYWIPDNKIIKSGSNITTDIYPFSYNLEYAADLIPENGIINIQKELNIPFDLKYYDVFLNGKKLTSKNIQIISNNRVAIMNVNSRKNLRIYSKDLDVSYFQIKNITNDLIDDMLESSEVSDEDKNMLLSSIIHSIDPLLNISNIIDSEPDYNHFDNVK